MKYNLTQERIVLLIAVALFAGFSLMLRGFFDPANLLSLVQNVSILGILGVAMAVAIIGRGIDLSMVSTMSLSVAWLLDMVNNGVALPAALALALLMVIAVGLINGFLIAYAEIPAIFATLAMGILVYGFGKSWLVNVDVVYLPDREGWFFKIGSSQIFGIPSAVLIFLAVSLLCEGFLRYLKTGRFIYAMGDNPQTARITGIPVRPMMLLQYVLISLVAFVAGIVMATAVSSMNTRVALSTLVYDVILVVVLGGIGLSGGKGNVRNVIVGTLLIGILLNGMTIMNLTYTAQNILKSLILLFAIVIDTILNPRDEQTAQHGDI